MRSLRNRPAPDRFGSHSGRVVMWLAVALVFGLIGAAVGMLFRHFSPPKQDPEVAVAPQDPEPVDKGKSDAPPHKPPTGQDKPCDTSAPMPPVKDEPSVISTPMPIETGRPVDASTPMTNAKEKQSDTPTPTPFPPGPGKSVARRIPTPVVGLAPHPREVRLQVAPPPRFVALPDPDRLYAMIEVGGSGVKYVLMEAYLQDGAVQTRVIEKKEVQTSGSLLKDGKLILNQMHDSAEQVALIFYHRLYWRCGISPKRVRVVLSSGYAVLPNRDRLEVELRAALDDPAKYGIDLPVEIARDKVGHTVPIDQISIKDETTYLIDGLGRGDHARLVLIDVGSSNVKCGYFVKGGEQNLPRYHLAPNGIDGTKVLASRARQAAGKSLGGGYLDALVELGRTTLTDQLQETAQANAGLVGRKQVYLLGGGVWAMTRIVLPQSASDPGDLIRLTAADIDRYHDLMTAGVRRGQPRFPDVDLSGLTPATREAAEAELARVRDVFTPEQLAAGAVILKTTSDAFQFADPTKALDAVANSQFAWATAYTRILAEKELLQPR